MITILQDQSQVLADPAVFEVIPTALDAWVRFAGRKQGTPEWAIALTREAIPRWRDEMTSAGSDPANGGPAKQFLTGGAAASPVCRAESQGASCSPPSWVRG